MSTHNTEDETHALSPRLSAPQIAQFLSPKSLITHQSSDQGFYKGDYESWWAKVLQRWQRSSIAGILYYSGTRPLNSYLISVGGWHRKSSTNMNKWMSETECCSPLILLCLSICSSSLNEQSAQTVGDHSRNSKDSDGYQVWNQRTESC